MSEAIVAEILEKAASLADSEKAEIASHLIEALPRSDYDVSDEEVAERRRQLESGEVEDISYEELKAGLDI